MPGRDGTGPMGTGRGAGARGRRGAGQQSNAGPDEFCVCPACGNRIPHTVGQPCNQRTCPQCGARLTRADRTM